MINRKISKEELISRYEGKIEQLQREVAALEINSSYLLIGETTRNDDGTITLSEIGKTIKNNAIAYNSITIDIYFKFIKEIRRIK